MITKLFFLGVSERQYNDNTYYKGLFLDNETSETIKLNLSQEDYNKLLKRDRFTVVDINIVTAQKGYDTVLYSCNVK